MTFVYYVCIVQYQSNMKTDYIGICTGNCCTFSVSWEWTKKKMEDGVDLPADITGARNVPTFRSGQN